MAINFPDSPSLNDTFVANSVTYTWNGTSWVSSISSALNASRTTVSGTTSSLADASTDNINIVGAAKTYSILKIEVDAASWVRIYTTDTARTNDSGRLETVDPASDAGVLAEIITTGPNIVSFTPSTIGFNDDTPVTDTLYLAVTNKSGITASITVSVTIFPLEV